MFTSNKVSKSLLDAVSGVIAEEKKDSHGEEVRKKLLLE